MSSTTQAQSSSTASELIETVSRAIKQLYKERLGKAPLLVTCNLLADRLVIWIEGSITPVEKLLFADGTPEAKSLCFTVDNIMRQHLTDVIERHLNVDVVTMIADTCYEHDCTGAIAKLSAPITSL
ncbi:MAG: Na-translocating system protein MpsC family protein [Phormidesmis sp.]